jgi:exosortase/archaeosortase family protein
MMKQTLQFRQLGIDLLKDALATWHGRIILTGLTVGILYFQAWLGGLFVRASQGSAGIPLIGAAVFIGLNQLWSNRRAIAQLHASEEDRTLGYLLIIFGVIVFPFCRFALWPQAIIWLVILGGVVISNWGVQFFKKYPLPTLLMIITVYPKPGALARTLWETMAPKHFLELAMAQAGAAGLRIFGLPAMAEGTIVTLPPDGSVLVGWGCNGFNMAFTMAATGLIMGLVYKQRWLSILAMMVLGIILALIFNIPRIMMLTIASLYWGENWFDFWHGGWGSQIFTTILFTPYYYAAMAIIKRRPEKAS